MKQSNDFCQYQLFGAGSVFKHLPYEEIVVNEVVVNWIHVGVHKTAPSYEKLITNYQHLDEIQRSFIERYIDELFTQDEIKQLGTYLVLADGIQFDLSDKKKEKFIINKIHFPIPDVVIGYGDIPTGGLFGRINLTAQQGYNLPFGVHGFFDISVNDHRYNLVLSAKYVRRVLQSLGLSKGVKTRQIYDVVDRLYDRDRLFVRRSINHMDWLNKIEV